VAARRKEEGNTLSLAFASSKMPAHCQDRLTLPLPADVAEWCPHPAALSALALGTYQLDESSQQRVGRLHMYRLERPEAAAAGADEAAQQALPPPPPLRLSQLSALDLPGIFDLRWHPTSAMPQLAAALADGSVRLLDFGAELASGGSGDAGASPRVTQLPGGEEAAQGMAVSLDYSRCPSCPGEQLAVSFSSGELQLFQVGRSPHVHAAGLAHMLDAGPSTPPHHNPTCRAAPCAGCTCGHGKPGNLAGPSTGGLGGGHRSLEPRPAPLGW
jgi:hypothetical protein